MMEQNPARPARKVAIADHIWDLFEEMAQQMGSDRDALINQAMFMFAKVNGFIDSGLKRLRSNSIVTARPSQVPHAKKTPPEVRTSFSGTLQRGQVSGPGSAVSVIASLDGELDLPDLVSGDLKAPQRLLAVSQRQSGRLHIQNYAALSRSRKSSLRSASSNRTRRLPCRSKPGPVVCSW